MCSQCECIVCTSYHPDCRLPAKFHVQRHCYVWHQTTTNTPGPHQNPSDSVRYRYTERRNWRPFHVVTQTTQNEHIHSGGHSRTVVLPTHPLVTLYATSIAWVTALADVEAVTATFVAFNVVNTIISVANFPSRVVFYTSTNTRHRITA